MLTIRKNCPCLSYHQGSAQTVDTFDLISLLCLIKAKSVPVQTTNLSDLDLTAEDLLLLPSYGNHRNSGYLFREWMSIIFIDTQAIWIIPPATAHLFQISNEIFDWLLKPVPIMLQEPRVSLLVSDYLITFLLNRRANISVLRKFWKPFHPFSHP